MKLDFAALSQPALKPRGQAGTRGTQASTGVSSLPASGDRLGTSGDIAVVTEQMTDHSAVRPQLSPPCPTSQGTREASTDAVSPTSPVVPAELASSPVNVGLDGETTRDPATIIQRAAKDGIQLFLTAGKNIKAIGKQVALQHWRSRIHDNKAAIVMALRETHASSITEVIDQCQPDADARDDFTQQPAAELPMSDPFPDNRRTCFLCQNLRGRTCTVAMPERGALVVANRGYRADPERLQRCAGYAPQANEPDQRTGAERWPGLIQKVGE